MYNNELKLYIPWNSNIQKVIPRIYPKKTEIMGLHTKKYMHVYFEHKKRKKKVKKKLRHAEIPAFVSLSPYLFF